MWQGFYTLRSRKALSCKAFERASSSSQFVLWVSGSVRMGKLKIYYAVFRGSGAIPWYARTFDNSICSLFFMSLHDVPPISRT